jgi:hypothetical protein
MFKSITAYGRPAHLPTDAAVQAQCERDLPEGKPYYWREVRRWAGGPRQFVNQFVIPRYRPEARGCKVVKVEDLPQVAATHTEMELKTIAGATCRATRTRIEYQVNGKAVEEDIYITMDRIPGQSLYKQEVMWGTEEVICYRAEKGKLDEMTRVLQAIHFSARATPQWFKVVRQVSEIVAKGTAERQAIMRRSIEQRGKEQGEISDMIWQQYKEQERVTERAHKDFIQTIRGVETYHDPVAKQDVELPNGYKEGWAGPNGTYILTEDPNFNPNVGSTSDWQKMQRAPN